MTEQRGLTAEQLRELRRPFPPEAIKFKGQSASANRNKALAVPYIDARLVIARLNHVVGPGLAAALRADGNGHVVPSRGRWRDALGLRHQ
jgi:hypothetical protein